MKRLLLMIATIFLISVGAIAQNTRVVTGAVIDKNGNPLPGAIVEATGGAESTIVDADGSFSIEVPIWLESLTVKYTGMVTKKEKLRGMSSVIFRMKPKQKGWFLNLEGSAIVGETISGRAGLMGGYLGKWGGYAKVTSTVRPGDGVPSITAGVIKSISKPLFCYAGLGYAPVVGRMYARFDDYTGGMMFDFGIIYKFNHNFNFNIGYSYSDSFGRGYDREYDHFKNHDIHFGFGYCF